MRKQIQSKILRLGLVIALMTFPGCSSKTMPEEEVHETGLVRFSPEVLSHLDLRIEEVRLQPLDEEIAATGKVIQDPDDITFVFSHRPGLLRKIAVQVGQAVQKGDTLLTIGGQRITAPRAGTVISLNAKEGASVGTMQSLVALADIDPIRGVLDVYPKDMDRVRIGQRAQIFLIGHEDEVFEGEVVYISPSLSAGSQSLKVGVDVANRGGHLKYGMFVHGKILDRVSEAALLIPEEAITLIGQESVVFIEKGPGEFEKRPIQVGRRGRKMVEVLSGLVQGEKVVAKGIFSLKSEALKHLMEEE